ncbi:MAG: GGDEF domain-containing protein [Candidatus Obscuribacterales bacterium]
MSGSGDEKYSREALFQRRLADLRAKNEQFPWNMEDVPEFDLPKDQSKLFADRSIEDPNLSDEEIERRALLDLTSYNFWTFYKRLNYECRRARRYERELCLLLVCIDDLQRVSRRHGLSAENQVVLSAGRVLLSCVRDVDIAGRCRDDTFGVILPETPIRGAEIAAERIRTKMEEEVAVFDQTQIPLSVSVAGTHLTGRDQQVDSLVAIAIEGLKECMAGGGNSVIVIE